LTSQVFYSSVEIMPNFLNQKGIAPVILVVILSVVFVGAFGVVYQSRKEIKIRSDKTSEVTQLKDSSTPVSESKDNEPKTEQNFKLSSKPFEQNNTSLPNFSFFPPDGWSKESGGNYIAPFKDKISEGVAYLSYAPSLNISAVSKDLSGLDEALALVKTEVKKASIEITSSKKVTLNGTEGYFVEGLIKYGELSRSALEAEIDKEIKNAQKKVIVSEDQIKKDIDTIVKNSDVKLIGYVFYQDGYVITFAGRALDNFWDSRGPQMKKSLDTFKFE